MPTEPVTDLPLPTVSERLVLSAGNSKETSKSFALKKTMYTEVHEQTQVRVMSVWSGCILCSVPA